MKGKQDSQPRGTEDQYRLIDSGSNQKLEQFGDKLLARPSGVCIWKRRKTREWDKVDAWYVPEGGWEFRREPFERWSASIQGVKLQLTLQSNGQIGFFPEHAQYLDGIKRFVDETRKVGESSLSALNLFAYTGLATLFLTQQRVRVCHVDLSKKALGWFQENCALNQTPKELVRVMCDDALKFLEREITRQNVYHLLIVDPPSFSRLSKTKHWKLSESLPELVQSCSKLLHPKCAMLVFTCHDPNLTAEMIANVLGDVLPRREVTVQKRELSIQEASSERLMSAGSLVMASYTGR